MLLRSRWRPRCCRWSH